MTVRKTLRTLAVVGLVAIGTAACGDKTVTTPPAASSATTVLGRDTASTGVASSSAAVDDGSDDARLAEVDQMLNDIEADLGAADQDVSTPEGDPTR